MFAGNNVTWLEDEQRVLLDFQYRIKGYIIQRNYFHKVGKYFANVENFSFESFEATEFHQVVKMQLKSY